MITSPFCKCTLTLNPMGARRKKGVYSINDQGIWEYCNICLTCHKQTKKGMPLDGQMLNAALPQQVFVWSHFRCQLSLGDYSICPWTPKSASQGLLNTSCEHHKDVILMVDYAMSQAHSILCPDQFWGCTVSHWSRCQYCLMASSPA